MKEGIGPAPRNVTSVGAPVLALLFNAFVFGVSWWPMRQLQGDGLHPVWSTAAIYAIGVSGVLLWRPQAMRGWLEHPLLWLLLLASGLNNLGFNWAMATGDVVRVILLFYLMPAWSVLLAWWLLDERPNRSSLARLALALCGVAVMLKDPAQPWPLPSGLADWLALMGGFMFALTNIMLRRLILAPGESRMLAMFGGGLVTGTLVGLAGGAMGLIAAPPALAPGWVLMVLALTLVFVLGNMTLQYGAARLSASASSIILLSEVVFSGISSVALGAAEITLRTLCGGGLILLAALLAAWAPRPR
jgi:drug/metabolite transporter (DMT)-like permease